MTCRYSGVDWRDALYNAVRNAPGGVKDAAAFLTERRGRTIHPEVLRAKLRHVDGESISMEMAELLTEWMQQFRDVDALAWVHAFNGRFGMAAECLDQSTEAAKVSDIAALTEQLLRLGIGSGKLAEIGVDAIADGDIDDVEADAIETSAMAQIRLLLRLTRHTRRAADSTRKAQPRGV